MVSAVVVTLLAGAGWYWYQQQEAPVSERPITVKVIRDQFVAHVLDQGEIQSSENVEIRCEVKQRNSPLRVLELVPEGTEVEAGDFLVQLEKTSFETELEQQKIAVANAKTQVIQAETLFETAKAAKLEYEQGIYVETRKTIENEVFDAESAIQTAMQELNQAKAVLAHSKKLQARGFITRQQLISDQFAVRKAEIAAEKGRNSEELARKKLHVLDNITQKKELIRLDSDIKASEVQLSSQQEALRVELAKERSIVRQIENCTIRVPKGVSGQVVYAVEQKRGDDWVLEKGTEVRQNQVLVRLPNPNKMEVKALVNEQSITRVRPEMPVLVQVDALNDRKLKGVVTKVNQYAESGGWMRTTVRKYGVFIQILDPPKALKPGMNASVSIQTNYEQNALLAPLQTVYGVQDRQFCLAVRGDGEYETLEVGIGGDNSEMVMFESGVTEGTELVMNPAAYKNLMELPEVNRDRRIKLPPGARAAFRKPAYEKGRFAKPEVVGRKPGKPDKPSDESASIPLDRQPAADQPATAARTEKVDAKAEAGS
jgi:multidrug resistance efflux pump